jgi:hypothetical protein
VSGGVLDPDAVREYLLAERHDLVASVLDCADAITAGWDGDTTADRGQVTGPLRTTLERAGVLEQFPALLRECTDAAGGRLTADPVAAPPYVVVTSVGPMLRATLSGGRLVVTFRVFRIERDEDGPRYARDARSVGDAVDVAVR